MVDLYREWNIEEWCEYLYENIWVFIDKCRSIRVNSEDRDEVQSEAILEAHKSIMKSLDNDYKQIYSYVRIRVIWRIKNFYLREYKIYRQYFETDIDFVDNNIEIDIDNKISDATVLQFILEWILTLSDSERQIIYLRIFNYPWKTLWEISKISGINKHLLSSKYIVAVKKIKEYLETKWLDYESLF